ncbi:MAG TPA: helix-turn-helix domain-containing protein [Acidimicrobiia bacterium]
MEPIRVNWHKEWLSVSDVCEYMGVSRYVVTSMLRSGELRGIKFGREWRVSRPDLEEWLNQQRGSQA